MPFEKNVFINCPLDDEFLPLLRPLLFSVLCLGLHPRIALESVDSGEARIEKIIRLVRESKFALHDLSRLRAARAGEYFRLNMPLELGLDVGCRRYKGGKWSRKRCLILEAKKFRYQAAISDLSNSDIAVHGNKPIAVVAKVRNWLNNVARLRAAPGPSKIWGLFNDFMADNYVALKERGFSNRDIERLPIDELIACMKKWLRKLLV